MITEPANKPIRNLPGGDDLAGSPPGSPAALPPHGQLLHFFNESRDLLCIAGIDGHFKRLSPSWSRLLGWSPAELLARPFLEFVHPDDQAATRLEMAKLGAGAPTIAFENRYQSRDGSWKWLQWTSTSMPHSQEIYAVARDVTLRKRLEQQILETLDHERERMCRELHDGLCQDLAGIAALSASLARRLTATAEAGTAREIGKLLNEAIRHARDLARGSNPGHLESIGLAAALKEFCLKTQNHFQVTCTFHSASSPPRLGAEREAHLYRIAQEAVNNAISHGRAKSIQIRLSFGSGGGTLEILDDGCGIGDLPDDHPGLGIHSMSYRAGLIGGTIELKSNQPHGTLVACWFSSTDLPPPSPHAPCKSLTNRAQSAATPRR